MEHKLIFNQQHCKICQKLNRRLKISAIKLIKICEKNIDWLKCEDGEYMNYS